MPHKRLKRCSFWAITVLLNVIVVEMLLSVYFFQRSSGYPSVIAHYVREAGRRFRDIRSREPVGIWETDPRFGFAHKANSKGTHRTADYDVTYTIGPEKERFIPAPENPAGRLLLLGGSWTFGSGVEDHENYAYILSTYWPEWKIVNRAVAAWGTSHAYMVLEDELSSDTPPSIVIYAMIPHHITRNYIRRSWVEKLAKYDRKHPHFEVVDGALVFQGVVSVPDSERDGPGVRSKELELTQSFLVAMQNRCSDKGVLFVVVLLNNKVSFSVAKTCFENDIRVLDLTEIQLERFRGDVHPNPRDHRLIADAISKSFITTMLVNREGDIDQLRGHGRQ